MAKSIFDLASDILKERLDSAFKVMSEQYKGKDPYRQEKVEPVEQLYEFNQIPDEVKQQLRIQMPQVYNKYEQDMNKIQERYNGRV